MGGIKLVLVYYVFALFCFRKTRFKLLVLRKSGESGTAYAEREKPVLKEFLWGKKDKLYNEMPQCLRSH